MNRLVDSWKSDGSRGVAVDYSRNYMTRLYARVAQ